MVVSPEKFAESFEIPAAPDFALPGEIATAERKIFLNSSDAISKGLEASGRDISIGDKTKAIERLRIAASSNDIVVFSGAIAEARKVNVPEQEIALHEAAFLDVFVKDSIRADVTSLPKSSSPIAAAHNYRHAADGVKGTDFQDAAPLLRRIYSDNQKERLNLQNYRLEKTTADAIEAVQSQSLGLISDYEQQNHRLTRQLETTQKEYGEDVIKSVAKLSELEADNVALIKKGKDLEWQLLQTKARVVSVEKELESTRAKESEANKSLDTAIARLGILEQDNGSLTQRCNDLKQHEESVMSKLSVSNGEVQVAVAAETEASKSLSSAIARIAVLENEKLSLSKSLTEMREKCDAQLADFAAKTGVFEKEKETLQIMKDAADASLTELTHRLVDFEAEYEKLKRRHTRLQEQVKKTTTTTREVQIQTEGFYPVPGDLVRKKSAEAWTSTKTAWKIAAGEVLTVVHVDNEQGVFNLENCSNLVSESLIISDFEHVRVEKVYGQFKDAILNHTAFEHEKKSLFLRYEESQKTLQELEIENKGLAQALAEKNNVIVAKDHQLQETLSRFGDSERLFLQERLALSVKCEEAQMKAQRYEQHAGENVEQHYQTKDLLVERTAQLAKEAERAGFNSRAASENVLLQEMVEELKKENSRLQQKEQAWSEKQQQMSQLSIELQALQRQKQSFIESSIQSNIEKDKLLSETRDHATKLQLELTAKLDLSTKQTHLLQDEAQRRIRDLERDNHSTGSQLQESVARVLSLEAMNRELLEERAQSNLALQKLEGNNEALLRTQNLDRRVFSEVLHQKLREDSETVADPRLQSSYFDLTSKLKALETRGETMTVAELEKCKVLKRAIQTLRNMDKEAWAAPSSDVEAKVRQIMAEVATKLVFVDSFAMSCLTTVK